MRINILQSIVKLAQGRVSLKNELSKLCRWVDLNKIRGNHTLITERIIISLAWWNKPHRRNLKPNLGLPSTLIRQENGAFENAFSNRRNLKTPALRVQVRTGDILKNYLFYRGLNVRFCTSTYYQDRTWGIILYWDTHLYKRIRIILSNHIRLLM